MWRGAMVNNTPSNEEIQRLFTHPVNSIRFPLIAPNANHQTVQEWRDIINFQVDWLEQKILPLCTTQKVIVDLHMPPLGYPDGVHSVFWTITEAYEALLTFWKDAANRFKDNPKIQAFDLLNEPAGSTPDTLTFMDKAVKTVRSVDPNRVCIVETPFGDGLKFSLLKPIKDPHVWYSFHMYYPLTFTHQGVYGRPTGVKCPPLDKIARYLQPVIEFRKKYKAVIYVGEFSTSPFTEESESFKYLSYILKVFEDNRFHWNFHDWNGFWTAERTPTFLAFMDSHWGKN